MSVNDDQSTDWLDALASDSEHFKQVINRVESLGVLAVEDIRQQNYKQCLRRLAEMGEGIRLCKTLVGIP